MTPAEHLVQLMDLGYSLGRHEPAALTSPARPQYTVTQYALSSFSRWLISNGHRAHAHWLALQAHAAKVGLPFIAGDLEQFANSEYCLAVEDSLSLSLGDDPDEDGSDEGEMA